jgi:predicted nucleic acid-binding protein
VILTHHLRCRPFASISRCIRQLRDGKISYVCADALSVDGQIAAIAAVNDLVLVTRNVRDFSGFAGLDVESWFSD